MDKLKQKIQNTGLFSTEEKLEIITVVDTYLESDTIALERIIDEFDATQRNIVSQYKKTVNKVLGRVIESAKVEDRSRIENAANLVRSGIDVLVQ